MQQRTPKRKLSPLIENIQDSSYNISDSIETLVTSGVKYMELAMPRFIQDLQTLCLTESPSEEKAGLDAMAELLAALGNSRQLDERQHRRVVIVHVCRFR